MSALCIADRATPSIADPSCSPFQACEGHGARGMVQGRPRQSETCAQLSTSARRRPAEHDAEAERQVCQVDEASRCTLLFVSALLFPSLTHPLSRARRKSSSRTRFGRVGSAPCSKGFCSGGPATASPLTRPSSIPSSKLPSTMRVATRTGRNVPTCRPTSRRSSLLGGGDGGRMVSSAVSFLLSLSM